jgi:alkanesulfonate monooxygenase SsuD/methylene tetrahydromethanopterin reductase-like flavin-dependent oxidoreductase (luciferase family)
VPTRGGAAAHPRNVVDRTVTVIDGTLAVCEESVDLDRFERLLVVGVGNGGGTLLLRTRFEGEARDVAAFHLDVLEECRTSGQPVMPPAVVVSGGELTVTVAGDGKGGPNQEFALSAALDGLSEAVVGSIDTDTYGFFRGYGRGPAGSRLRDHGPRVDVGGDALELLQVGDGFARLGVVRVDVNDGGARLAGGDGFVGYLSGCRREVGWHRRRVDGARDDDVPTREGSHASGFREEGHQSAPVRRRRGPGRSVTRRRPSLSRSNRTIISRGLPVRVMQFDWMVQCYPGGGVHRDAPLLDSLEREVVMQGVDTVADNEFGGLWAPDHFMLGPHHEEYEVWTLLSALAERTDDVDLGPLVGSITYRNPALLAKMASTVDILSEGRLRLGLGAGWHDVEHAAYGYEFPDIETRLEMLEEGIQVIQAMFTEDVPTFEGEHYSIDEAYNQPKPIQDPHPPIVIGGAGPKLLRIASKYADEWNVEISSRARGPDVEFKAKKFDEYLEEAGRDPDSVERSWLAHVLVCEDDETVQEYCDRIFPLPWGEESDMEDAQLSSAADAKEKGDFIIGTPAEVVEQIESVRDLGFTKLQLMFLDFPETDGMELFADEVMPAFD